MLLGNWLGCAAATLTLTGVLGACSIDAVPSGLRATPSGDGPTVLFDVEHRPLPKIPFPNDIATFADPSSRTGRRLNVSMIAPTGMEKSARDGFSEMEGWGTFAPISVSFAPSAHHDPQHAALDLQDIHRRMQEDGYEFANDCVYVINLTTGVPVILDMGHGNFPATIAEPGNYYPNDPRRDEQNILFETAEEGAGVTQYKPSLDTDFDGVLDHPNTLGGTSGVQGVDNLMTWYERETDSLILRPLIPMEEKTEYAVILTDRLKGENGEPVRSPFPFIHHPEQKDAIARVRDILGDRSRANYYGDIAGSGLEHVAFAWSFTTQPVYEDMRLLRDGLYGKGPFARLGASFPAKSSAFRAVGLARDPADESPGSSSDPRCKLVQGTPYIVKKKDAAEAIHVLLQRVLPFSVAEAKALEDSLDNVDHLVIGTFASPYFLGDPERESTDGHFHLDFRTGEGNVVPDAVHFWLAVPKATPGHGQPFPTVVWAHGTGNNDAEIIVRAGYFARHGIATFGIDLPGHGLVADRGLEMLAEALLRNTCMVPWTTGIISGRARDLNGDGVPDSGGLYWSAHLFHTRDTLRQSVVDELQATRVLRAFDQPGDQDFNGDGSPDKMGDFDGDGVADVGGATSLIYTSGNSLGGVLAQMHGALDPNVTASAPISGAGGATDTAGRSDLAANWTIEQLITPLVVAMPSSDLANDVTNATACGPSERSVRFVINDLTNTRQIEVACLSSAELSKGMTVVLTNTRNQERRCARTGDDGRFRLPIPANIGDHLDIQLFTAADAVDSYGTCNVLPDALANQVGRRIKTWEQAAKSYKSVGDDSKACPPDTSCQQFRDQFYAVGDPLCAPQEGFGLYRQSHQFRELFALTQAALDVGDPVNFAPYFMLKPLPGIDGVNVGPHALLASYTVGDPTVPIGTGYAFARAAGAVPFLPPSAAIRFPEYAAYATPPSLFSTWGGKTPNELLIESHAAEGVARLERAPAGTSCASNYVRSAGCVADPGAASTTCRQTLFDTDWHAEGRDRYDQQHLADPLRLARSARIIGTDADSLERSWAPRILGAPAVGADNAWQPNGPVVAMVSAYINPLGQHVWTVGNPCKAWDDAVYYDNLLAHFLATSGSDVYALSHPKTHRCLADSSCDFFH